jgi:hypothetical protein
MTEDLINPKLSLLKEVPIVTSNNSSFPMMSPEMATITPNDHDEFDTGEAFRISENLRAGGRVLAAIGLEKLSVQRDTLRRQLETAQAKIFEQNTVILNITDNCAENSRRIVDERNEAQARIKEMEAQAVPKGWKLVPVEPADAMIDRAVAFALNVKLHAGYDWSAYMADLYGRIISAAPEPKP